MISVTALDQEGSDLHIHIQVKATHDVSHPVAVLALIDNSGSMNLSGQQNLETEKLSCLDLVKHCLRTTVAVLRDQDYLALVTFNTFAETKLNFTRMNTNGKEQANRLIDSIQADYATNLWKGMKMALDLWDTFLSTMEGPKPHQSLLMLTDGQSNVNPNEGLVLSVKQYVQERQFQGVIHAMGFGYEIDSQAIFDIAQSTQGSYSFISDNSMLANVMISFLVNLFRIVHDQCDLRIIFHRVLNLPTQLIRLGSIHHGQTRDYSFTVALPNDVPPQLCTVLGLGQEVTLPAFHYTKTPVEQSHLEYIRHKFIQMLEDIIVIRSDFSPDQEKNEKIKALFRTFLALINNNQTTTKMFARELDSSSSEEGQVAKAALRSDWFEKWGHHHFLALIRAHELQIRHNLKDPSVQQYGGVPTPNDGVPSRDEIMKKCNQAFLSVPLPQHAIKSSQQYLAGEGCIDGDCLVEMKDNQLFEVCDLKAGDVTASGATIQLVIVTSNKRFKMIKVNNLLITPWHPIQLNGTEQWVFPHDVDGVKEEYERSVVYNLVLDRDHYVIIDGIKVITVGHGIQGDAVASHDYFGSYKFLNDLLRFTPDDRGRIVLENVVWTRDVHSQRVNGIM